MWRLIFHISEIINPTIGTYEPGNYSIEIQVSTDIMLDIVKRGVVYINDDRVTLFDEGRNGSKGNTLIFDNCSVKEG